MITPKERNFVIAAIKRVFSRSMKRRGILEAAKAKKKGPRGGRMFICAKCKKAFSSSQVQVDHIDPVVPIGQSGKDMSLDLILDRLWCDDKNLQVLCTPCHKKKSREEAQLRKKARSK